jgi:hypothetical protein
MNLWINSDDFHTSKGYMKLKLSYLLACPLWLSNSTDRRHESLNANIESYQDILF